MGLEAPIAPPSRRRELLGGGEVAAGGLAADQCDHLPRVHRQVGAAQRAHTSEGLYEAARLKDRLPLGATLGLVVAL